MTGWALDDVEVTAVEIWRDPHPNDPAGAVFGGGSVRGGKVFVGFVSLVEGARPDNHPQRGGNGNARTCAANASV